MYIKCFRSPAVDEVLFFSINCSSNNHIIVRIRLTVDFITRRAFAACALKRLYIDISIPDARYFCRWRTAQIHYFHQRCTRDVSCVKQKESYATWFIFFTPDAAVILPCATEACTYLIQPGCDECLSSRICHTDKNYHLVSAQCRFFHVFALLRNNDAVSRRFIRNKRGRVNWMGVINSLSLCMHTVRISVRIK